MCKYWLIPESIYSELNKEFNFDFDPCPYPALQDGTLLEWGKANWVNPPFLKKDALNGKGPTAFVRKAIEEQKKDKTTVLILSIPHYIHLLLLAGAEIRPVGRVKWEDADTHKPQPSPPTSALFILRPKTREEKVTR